MGFFFFTLKNLKNPQKERTYEVDEKFKKLFSKENAVSVSLSFFIQYTDFSVLEKENEKINKISRSG
jgi:hypothetical protein